MEYIDPAGVLDLLFSWTVGPDGKGDPRPYLGISPAGVAATLGRRGWTEDSDRVNVGWAKWWVLERAHIAMPVPYRNRPELPAMLAEVVKTMAFAHDTSPLRLILEMRAASGVLNTPAVPPERGMLVAFHPDDGAQVRHYGKALLVDRLDRHGFATLAVPFRPGTCGRLVVPIATRSALTPLDADAYWASITKCTFGCGAAYAAIRHETCPTCFPR
jgi:hypothetical protein